MTLKRGLALTLLLSLLGAALGVWGGATFVVHRMRGPTPFHEMVHKELHMTPAQARQVARLERDHAVRKTALEAEMRAANGDLARAYQERHAYTPAVQAAIDRFHHAMSALQTETVMHVLAMRSVLTASQATSFDETVVRSLTSEPR